MPSQRSAASTRFGLRYRPHGLAIGDVNYLFLVAAGAVDRISPQGSDFFCSGIFLIADWYWRLLPTANGLLTSPMCGPRKGDSMWLSSSICSRGVWSAG